MQRLFEILFYGTETRNKNRFSKTQKFYIKLKQKPDIVDGYDSCP